MSAGSPGANGIHVWSQLAAFGLGSFRVWFMHGQVHSFEIGALPGVSLLYLGVAYIVGGRLWRLLPQARG